MSRPAKRKTTEPRSARVPRPRHDPAMDGMPSLVPVFETALRTARGIHATLEPLEVEVTASGLLGTFDRPLVDVASPVDFFGQRFIAHLTGKRSPDALAILHGIAAVADEPLAGSARSAIMRLHAAGRTDPPFASRIGRYRFVDAWTSIDEFGDQEMVAVSFADPADQLHALAFMIDHNFGGLVREALLAPDLDGVRSTWAETSGMEIVTLEAQELADRLGQGLRMYDEYLDPPCSDAVGELAMLMKARLRALPPPREQEYHEVAQKERTKIVAAFVASKEAARAPDARLLARYLVDYRLDYTDGDPLRWSPIAVELCLLDRFPRKATLDDDAIASLPDVLRRFVRYAGRLKGLPRASIEETLGAVDQFAPGYLEAMRDRSRFGPAKSLVDEMLGDGLDLSDERAVAAWIEAFNARPLDERDAVLGSIGISGDRAAEDPFDVYDTTDLETLDRRRWTIPAMTGVVRGIDAEILDPTDPDERRLLIEIDHPELIDALDRGDDEVDVGGAPMNPHLHIALHEIVANQLWDGEPPETWEAAKRLRDLGHDRHEVLHMLAGAVAGVVGTSLGQRAHAADLTADMRAALRSLPGGLSSKAPRNRQH